jgi:hypothetical protein
MFFHKPFPSIRCENIMGNTKLSFIFITILLVGVNTVIHPFRQAGARQTEDCNWRHYEMFSLAVIIVNRMVSDVL